MEIMLLGESGSHGIIRGGTWHTLFSVGQFCDSDLEVAFRKHTCFVRDIKGTDILKGSRGTNLYTISIDEMMKSSPICLMVQASKSKSWLWHRQDVLPPAKSVYKYGSSSYPSHGFVWSNEDWDIRIFIANAAKKQHDSIYKMMANLLSEWHIGRGMDTYLSSVGIISSSAPYQAKPTKKHFEAIKRVFRYLKGTINMGLWYPKDNAMSLIAYADAEHAGWSRFKKSTSEVLSFLGDRLVSWSSRNKEARSKVPAQHPTETDEQIVPTISVVNNREKKPTCLCLRRSNEPLSLRYQWNFLSHYQLLPSIHCISKCSAIYLQQLCITIYPFELPPSGDTVIDFINELGYPEPVEIVSSIRTNYVYQPWRAILSLLNQCLTGKTLASGEQTRQPCSANDVGESSTQTNSEKNPKKKVTPLLIPYGRFSKVIIYYLASNNNIHRRPDSAVHHTGDDYILGNLKFVPKGESVEVFGMAIPDPLITEAIQQSSYYPKYLKMVAENTKKTPQKGKACNLQQSVLHPKSLQPPHQSNKPSQLLLLQRNLPSLSLDPAFLPQGRVPVGGVTIRDPVSETTSKLHEVVGKGKAVVTEEQVAHSLIDMSKKKRTTDQFILVRRDQTPPDSTTGPSSQHDDDTSEKVIHESSSTSDSERTESETETAAPKDDKDQGEVDSSTVTSGVSIPVSDPVKAHEALAGPDPEPMKEDQTDSDSGKNYISDPESGHSEQSSDDIPMKDEGNDSDMEDTDNAHIPKVSTTTRTGKKKLCKADLEGPAFNLVKAFHKNSVFLQYQMDECHKLLYNKVDLCDKERRIALSISKLKAARYLDFGLEELVPSLWVESEREYDISAVYGITHWWFRRKEFYINKHSESSDREAVRSQMRILSVISVKINLERPNWDAADYYFKEDYTIVPKPRAVVYRDINDQRKLMRLNELHKFSDGTLTRVMEKVDLNGLKTFICSSTIRAWKLGSGQRMTREEAKTSSQPHKGVKASANSDIMYSFTSAQDGNPLQDDVRLCLGDDLKKAQDHSQRQA
ncbi:hypothetical protein Tco_1108751 [Tanacetum coccineum]